jgi:hypothetical protein
VRCTLTSELRGRLGGIPKTSSSGFKSGRWLGSYHQFEMDHPQILDVGFESGEMVGAGADEIGPFLIAGRYNETTAAADWLKHYIGRHTVVYSGRLTGATLSGQWTLRDDRSLLNGSFSLTYSEDET